MRLLESTSEIVEALGGTSAVSRLTGRKLPSVSNWKALGRFPPETYVVFKTALAAIECEAPDLLWQMLERPESGTTTAAESVALDPAAPAPQPEGAV